MRKLSRDTLAVVGVLAAMILVAALVVYLPQARKLEDLRSGMAAQKASLQEDSNKVQIVPQMVRQVDEMKRAYSQGWDKKLPRRAELGAFLQEISANLNRENLSGKAIEPGNPEQGQLYHTLPIVMKFQGTFESLKNFLDRLEHMERLTRVERLEIKTTNAEIPANLDVLLRLNIYFTDTDTLQS